LARLYVAGGVRLEGPAGTLEDGDLPGHQGRIALVALAVERRALRRDELAEVIWDGTLPQQWSAALNALVSKLRSLVSSTGLDGRSTLPAVGSAYRLVLPPGSWIDLEDGYRRLDRAEGAIRHADAATAVVEATVAAGILGRLVLPGVDATWADDVNRARTDALFRCYVALARGWTARGDLQLAATVAERAIAVDPYREVAHRLLVEAELGRGDHAAAARALGRCERIIGEELGVAVSPETVQLRHRLER
jgi:DNA-binding SARP family transcriptional activator